MGVNTATISRKASANSTMHMRKWKFSIGLRRNKSHRPKQLWLPLASLYALCSSARSSPRPWIASHDDHDEQRKSNCKESQIERYWKILKVIGQVVCIWRFQASSSASPHREHSVCYSTAVQAVISCPEFSTASICKAKCHLRNNLQPEPPTTVMKLQWWIAVDCSVL